MNSSAQGVIGWAMMAETPGGSVHVPVGSLKCGLGLRQGGQFQYRLGDNGQGSFRADQQAREVIAHHPLGGDDAGPDLLTRTGDRAQAQRVFPRGVVFDCPWTGRIIGQVTADGANGRAGGIWRPEEAVWLQCLLQCLIGHARLDPGDPVGRINLQNPVHPLQGQDDATPVRYRGAGGAGSLASGNQWNPLPVAKRHYVAYLFMGGGEHHRLGQGLAATVVVTVRPAITRLGQHRRTAGNCDQLLPYGLGDRVFSMLLRCTQRP